MHWLHFKLPCNNTNFIVSNFLFCHSLSFSRFNCLRSVCMCVCFRDGTGKSKWKFLVFVMSLMCEPLLFELQRVLNDWFFVVMKLIRLCNANFPYVIYWQFCEHNEIFLDSFLRQTDKETGFVHCDRLHLLNSFVFEFLVPRENAIIVHGLW